MLIGLGLAAAGPAGGDSTQSTIFDPGPILDPGLSSAHRARTLDRIQDLGADTVRVLVRWRAFAPRPNTATAPAGFDGADPDEYPRGAFETLDQVVRGVDQRGLRLLLTPSGPAPDWASASAKNDHVYPDPGAFERFVAALGMRYRGECQAQSCDSNSTPPRVSFWSVWNEPNLALFLRPQYVRGRAVAGRIYRRLFLAARRGLDDSGHALDPVLIGETAPSGGSISTPPIQFLRQTLCLDSSTSPPRRCAPIRAAGWAQHPYTPGLAPWLKPTNRQLITVGALSRLQRALRRAYRTGATEERLPVFLTEFGIQSYPKPARQLGVSQLRQAEYLALAEFLLYRDPWVRSYAQYLMSDDRGNPAHHLTFKTGLRFADDRPKLSYSSFPIALAVRRRGAAEVEIWGHVRPKGGPFQVRVSYRDADGTAGTLPDVITDQDGYFDFVSDYRVGRRWQASSTLTGGRELQGPPVRAYRF